MTNRHLECVIATDTGAFGCRWWLRNESGQWSITRERTAGGAIRSIPFDSEQEAREYFNTYTAKFVEQTA